MTDDFLPIQARAWTVYRHQSLSLETVNGPGSRLEATVAERDWLPSVFREYNVTRVIDAPCGDWNWMQHVDLRGVEYLGLDVERTLIAENLRKFGDRGVQFMRTNLLSHTLWLPDADLILCRDFLQHLPNEHISRLLGKFIASGARYLITNNYRGASNDTECPPEGHVNAVGSESALPGYYYRPVNVETEPFNLVGRVESIVKDTGDESEYTDIIQELVLFDLDWNRKNDDMLR
jgi:hypothetical protein